MSSIELIELLRQELQNSLCDIKAEAQLLMAQEKGLRSDDYMISCNKRFIREYSRDLVSANLIELTANRSILQVQLSRTGIYDQLPEGIFFQSPQRSNHSVTAADMVLDYKENKKKEEDIRRFFLPFENDFFLQRIKLEEQETLLLQGLQSGYLNDYFMRFWNLPASIPSAFVAPLILLLPYAYKIAGNRDLMAQSLEQILNEPVFIDKKRAPKEDAKSIAIPVLDEAQLGVDFVCGEAFIEDSPVFEIEIGPLQNSRIADYLEAGPRCVLIETFTRFFVPAGVDSIITITIPVERRNMIIAKDNEPVLGYSTFLE
jgi:hypothetical protein